ncbi:hypothetical protein GGI10_000333 [Coemansia sp. RSA 2530]|nr:hypothetical protein GGI10_000333 [Coemansia sp. RSA 2530]
MTIAPPSGPSDTTPTPITARVLSGENLTSAGSKESERNSKSKLESSSVAHKKIIVVPEVLSLALPLDKDTRGIATSSAESISQLLQALLSGPEQGAAAPGQPLLQISDDVLHRLRSLAQGLRPWVDCKAAAVRQEKDLYPYFRKLVLFVMECLKALLLSTTIRDHYRLILPYSGVGDFKPKDSLENFKLDQALSIRPWCDVIGDGVDEPCYIDMLAVVEMKVGDTPKTSSRTNSSRTSSRTSSRADGGTFPARLSASGVPPKSNIGAAHGQLVRYTRQIYEHQHSRFYSWGVTSCGSLVRVYLFGPDCAMSTADLDMRTSAGRKDFVSWLANMCLCEDRVRGFIPSMKHVDGTTGGKGAYWELHVPMLDSHGAETDKTRVYYSRDPSFVASSTFGRHTRGFPASASLANIDDPDVFVKVAWQYADRGPGPTRKTEIQHLLDIRHKSASAAHHGVNVPIIVDGGTVKAVDRDGCRVCLTSDTVYGKDIATRYAAVDDLSIPASKDNSSSSVRSRPPPPFNLHLDAPTKEQKLLSLRKVNMLATTPLCQPLSSVQTPDELIVVLADATRAHNWLLTECGLLHRDISSNNILVGRRNTDGGDSEVYGLLIDFDYAINPSDSRLSRPERTGTLPFMSILTLEAHPGQQTELDDFESLFYVLCFQATFGINKKDSAVLKLAHETMDLSLLKIKDWQGWQEGKTMAGIASDKRSHMSSIEAFESNIANHFPIPDLDDSSLPNYFDLQLLASELYGVLFENPDVDKRCRGAYKTSKRVPHTQVSDPTKEIKSLKARLSSMTLVTADPMVERTKDPAKKTLVSSFIEVIERSAFLAKGRIAALSNS